MAYFHVKKDRLDPNAKKDVFVGFKKAVICYKIWDPKDKKFILSRDVTFDETSMMKPINSQQVESKMTDRISKSGATSPSLDRSILFKIIPTVTQGSDHVADQDTDDDENQGQVMGDVHESILVKRTRRNPRKTSWLITDMIVAYLFQSLKWQSHLHIGKLKSVQSPKYGRISW